MLDDNGEKMEIKAGPDINKYLDEINQNLNVSYHNNSKLIFYYNYRAFKSISTKLSKATKTNFLSRSGKKWTKS
jgi:hypothetical protein